MDWVSTIRLINALGALVCVGLLLRTAHKQWRVWNFKTQQYWWSLVGWTSLCVEGTVETMFINVAGGPRTVITTLVVAWTLRAILIDDDVQSKSVYTRKDKS